MVKLVGFLTLKNRKRKIRTKSRKKSGKNLKKGKCWKIKVK